MTMDLSWIVVLGAMLIALGFPFLLWGMFRIMQGLTETRTDLKDSTQTVQKSLDAQSGNVQNVLTGQEKLIERIQHLEAIVTSEAWDTLARDKQERIAQDILDLDLEESDADRAARLARNIDRDGN